MRIWRSLGVVNLVFSFTLTAFFLVGTFGSQFKINTLSDTFRTYLYKQTSGDLTVYFAGHPDALFGCSTPTIIFGLAIAAGVIGTALSLIRGCRDPSVR